MYCLNPNCIKHQTFAVYGETVPKVQSRLVRVMFSMLNLVSLQFEEMWH